MGSKNKAIIVSDCGIVKAALTYKDVRKIRDLITEFIAKHVKDKNVCMGLRMAHNLYIPSIVLSLQELGHAFFFMEVHEAEALDKLGIVWVLSSEAPNNCVELLNLDHHVLFLEQLNNRVKHYENIFYIIKTSGTTGESKFVKVAKPCIESNITSLSRIFGITPSDTIYFGTPLTFDPSMVELLLALNSGACLLITSHNIISPTRLHQTLVHPVNGVSVLQMVPSLFKRWSQQEIETIVLSPTLKILAFGGEQFPVTILSLTRSNQLRIFNLYGITEVSCWATIYETQADDHWIPIGEPLDETVIEIRDDSGDRVCDGEGEIFIGSDHRVCYIDDEELHQNRLVFRATGDLAKITNQRIYYQERKNDTFKRFGHKIHLSKIEKSIQEAIDLPNCCVWSKTQSKLLVFIVTEIDNMKDKILDKIRIKLLHTLPKHHFPDHIDIIRKCPITYHGKIDRKALEALYLKPPKSDNSTIDIFKTLICRYFGLNESHLSNLMGSTFFELGGNSILAMQFLGEFAEVLGIESPPGLVAALFDKTLNDCLPYCLSNTTKKRPCEVDPKPIKKTKGGIELRVVWAHNLQACVDSTPLVFQKGSRSLVAVGSFSHIFAVLDANTGAVLCEVVLPDAIESAPCLSPCQNHLYVGCFDGLMYCMGVSDGQIKWSYATGDRIKSTPSLCRRSTAIVFGSYDKHLHCVEITTGHSIWKTKTEAAIAAAPLHKQGKIFVGTIGGGCLCLAADTGEVQWRYDSGAPIFGTCCFYNDSIIWGNVQGKVVALSLEGKRIWDCDNKGNLFGSLLCHQQSLIFGSHDCNLHILEVRNGDEAAKISLDDKITSMPCLLRDFITIATSSGVIYLVDFGGGVMGELRLPSQVFSSPAVHQDRIYIGCRDNNLYCIGQFAMDRVPGQTGHLLLNEEGAVLGSSGDLENDEKSAVIIMGLVNLTSYIDRAAFPDEGFKKLSITYDKHCYIICLSNRKIHVVKKAINGDNTNVVA